MPANKQPTRDIILRLKKTLSDAELDKKIEEALRRVSTRQQADGFTHVVPVAAAEGDEVVIHLIPAKVSLPEAMPAKPAPEKGWSAKKK